jgi:glycosyltransferase involved in cell wall biosynthesis
VLASSFNDYEYIIVDDCSSDSSFQIACEYAKRDRRIRAFRNEINLGDYHNRNKAASYASGKYLKYVDSDDLIYPHGLAIMVESMERFPEAGLGLCAPAPANTPHPCLLSPEMAYERHFLGMGLFAAGPLGAIIHRERFQDIGYFSGARYIGDNEAFLALGARFPVLLIQRDLVWWRTHEGQEYSQGITSGAYLKSTFGLEARALNSPLCPLSEVSRREALAKSDISHAVALVVGARHGHLGELVAALKEHRVKMRSLIRAFIQIMMRR